MTLFFILGGLGVLFLTMGFVFLKWPPREINYLYGYRTKKSMSSPERWKYAQDLSSRLMIKGGVMMFLLSLTGFFIRISETGSAVISIVALSIFVIFLFVKVETALVREFGKN